MDFVKTESKPTHDATFHRVSGGEIQLLRRDGQIQIQLTMSGETQDN